MDGTRFDRLTRFMARETTRRHAFKTMAAGAVSSGALLAAAAGANAQAAAGGERAVLGLELLAAELLPVGGQNCAAVKSASDAFRVKYADLLAQGQADLAAMTQAERAAHTAAYGDRIGQASAMLKSIATGCGYAPNSTSAFTFADLNSDKVRQGTPVPPGTAVATIAGGTGAYMEEAVYRLPGGPQPDVPERAQNLFCGCGTCNNNCICNCLDAGSCTAMFFGCIAGSSAGCCYFGMCVTPSTCPVQCSNCIRM